MTITAKDAKALTNSYVKTECIRHLDCIEGIISARAKKGYVFACYACDNLNSDARIKEFIKNELKDAGYEIHWDEANLHISWRNA